MKRSFLLSAALIAITFSSVPSGSAMGWGRGGGLGGSSAYRNPLEAANWVSHSTWGDYYARNQAMQQPWHGDYYYLKTGQPTALVVSPYVRTQANYSWGVSQNTMTPVYHQFGQGAAAGSASGVFKATPYWPTHTDQFGVYPVRGPWQ